MTDPRLSLRQPDGETVLWEGRPGTGALYFSLALAGLCVFAGLFVLLGPLHILIAGFEASVVQRIVAGLLLIGFGAALGAAYWRLRPSNLLFQLTDRQLRIFVGDRLARRLVRGELRHLLCRSNPAGGATLVVAKTNAFTGNPAGLTQGTARLAGLADAQQVLARLANWTTGDERAAESAAAAFNADPDADGRELSESRHGIHLRVPAGWPVEARSFERGPAKAFGRELPVNVIRYGALLPLQDAAMEWHGLRVRASDRAGFYLEVSERCGDDDLREARGRWENPGPLQGESDSVPIPGFRGLLAEQAPTDRAEAIGSVEACAEWTRDGVEDQGFGLVGAGAHRILLWATDGRVAIQLRGFAPAADSESARAIHRVIESIRIGDPGVD